MKVRTMKALVLTGTMLAGSMMFLPGCLFSPKDSGTDNGLSSAQLAGDEVSNMSVDAGNMMDGAGLAKTANTDAETTYISRTVHPYSWNAAIQAFTRSATFTTSNGYERTRMDTVTFRDAAGASLEQPTLATVSTIHHVRHVTHQRGGQDANVLFTIDFTLNKETSDTTLVKNGAMTGSYGGEQFATGSAVAVTRHRVNGRWQFPASGTLNASFPRYTYNLEYLGSGSATATVHNLVKDKVTVYTVQVDQR